MRKIKWGLLLCLVLLLAGCAIEDAPEKKSQPDFTLAAAEDVPSQLQEQIEAAKDQEMKIVFYDGEYLYIVRGYGEQPAGSGIRVLELYETDDGLVLNTEITGPGTESTQTTSDYPYIVVKLESDEQNVVFL
jgi:hypothetical protein